MDSRIPLGQRLEPGGGSFRVLPVFLKLLSFFTQPIKPAGVYLEAIEKAKKYFAI
jgi:hypothetical protein